MDLKLRVFSKWETAHFGNSITHLPMNQWCQTVLRLKITVAHVFSIPTFCLNIICDVEIEMFESELINKIERTALPTKTLSCVVEFLFRYENVILT